MAGASGLSHLVAAVGCDADRDTGGEGEQKTSTGRRWPTWGQPGTAPEEDPPRSGAEQLGRLVPPLGGETPEGEGNVRR